MFWGGAERAADREAQLTTRALGKRAGEREQCDRTALLPLDSPYQHAGAHGLVALVREGGGTGDPGR